MLPILVLISRAWKLNCMESLMNTGNKNYVSHLLQSSISCAHHPPTNIYGIFQWMPAELSDVTLDKVDKLNILALLNWMFIKVTWAACLKFRFLSIAPDLLNHSLMLRPISIMGNSDMERPETVHTRRLWGCPSPLSITSSDTPLTYVYVTLLGMPHWTSPSCELSSQLHR